MDANSNSTIDIAASQGYSDIVELLAKQHEEQTRGQKGAESEGTQDQMAQKSVITIDVGGTE